MQGQTDEGSNPTLTIGAVSKAAGVPANTLRSWERRYGFPTPLRTESGQRVYAPDVIEHLRWIVRALDRGLRPGQVLTISLAELKRTLATTADAPTERVADPEAYVRAWIEATRRLDGESLERAFRTEAAHLGAMRFLVERVAPFLVDLGDAWACGDLQVFQEHFVSARIQGHLGSLWRPIADRNRGPLIVATTLPGELHGLGLEMAATTLALCGWRVVHLGPNTPPVDIAAAVGHAGAAAVAISASVHASARTTRALLTDLVRRVDVPVIVGGSGAPEDVDGTLWLPDLPALAAWATQPA